MLLIGENIHIISKTVKEALLKRDRDFFTELIKLQENMDFIDLNVGPAKGSFQGVLPWLVRLVQENSSAGISFDTTNFSEMQSGFEVCSNSSHAFINSTSNDPERFDKLSDLAVEKDSNIIALTMDKTGIPKTSDGRLEIASDMYEKFLEKGIDTEKIYFDPLVLPVTADQSQAPEAINTIKMIKESFDPPVKTLVGLSNISNGCPAELRPLINRVFAVMAFGAGLDAAIIDAKDLELVRIFRMLELNSPQNKTDELYIDIARMVEKLSDLSDIEYNSNSEEQTMIIKTVEILSNHKVYSHSFTQI